MSRDAQVMDIWWDFNWIASSSSSRHLLNKFLISKLKFMSASGQWREWNLNHCKESVWEESTWHAHITRLRRNCVVKPSSDTISVTFRGWNLPPPLLQAKSDRMTSDNILLDTMFSTSSRTLTSATWQISYSHPCHGRLIALKLDNSNSCLHGSFDIHDEVLCKTHQRHSSWRRHWSDIERRRSKRDLRKHSKADTGKVIVKKNSFWSTRAEKCCSHWKPFFRSKSDTRASQSRKMFIIVSGSLASAKEFI